MFLIDRFPRNYLVSFGTIMVTTCLTAEAAIVANYPVGPGQNNTALRAGVAMTFCYMVILSSLQVSTALIYPGMRSTVP
jgi:hypothetical protein